MTARALTIADYQNYSDNEQATYVTAAVSMMIFQYADQGDKQRASCLNNWYFRRPVVDGKQVSPPGPAEMAREIARVRGIDPTFHVEEIVLDMVKKACGGAAPR